jgi:hypothetical protein
MSKKNYPVHIQNLFDNFDEVRRLLAIHEKVSGDSRGYKSKVEVLNKSAIVLMVACWEAYIEDLASSAFDFMLENAKNYKVFPDNVLTIASKELRLDKDERMVWELAEKGWQKVLKEHKKQIIKKYINNFNTPRSEIIDKLFKELIGLSNLSSNWHWFGKSSDRSRKDLSDLVTLRGSISHRVSATKKVYKKEVWNKLEFINKLALKSHNRVCAHIHSRTKKPPWNIFSIGKIL